MSENQTTPEDDVPSFPEALATARRIADAIGTLTECRAPADVAMACCILIHRMEPSGEHLAPFARKLLHGREWVGEDMAMASDQQTTNALTVGQEWRPAVGRRAKPRLIERFCTTPEGYPGVNYRTSEGASYMTVEGFMRWIKTMEASAHG